MNMDVITAKTTYNNSKLLDTFNSKLANNQIVIDNSSNSGKSDISFEGMLNNNLKNMSFEKVSFKDEDNSNDCSKIDENVKTGDVLSFVMALIGQVGQTNYVDSDKLPNKTDNLISDSIQGMQINNSTYEVFNSFISSLNSQHKITVTDGKGFVNLNEQITNLLSQVKDDSNFNNLQTNYKNILNLNYEGNLSSAVNEAVNSTSELISNKLLNVQQLAIDSEYIQKNLQNLVINNQANHNLENNLVNLNKDIVNKGTNSLVEISSKNSILDEEVALYKAIEGISIHVNKDIKSTDAEIPLFESEDINKVNVDILDNKNELNKTIVNEELLKVNGVDVEANNQIIKVNDESSKLKDSVITQIKDKISFMKINEKQTVTLELTPESLGKLDIKMVFDKGGKLIIDIIASNPKTQSLILSNISELKSVLQSNFGNKAVINVECHKQIYEDSSNQNGYQQEHQNRDENEKQYEQIYNDNDEDDELSDFIIELSKYRNSKFSYIN